MRKLFAFLMITVLVTGTCLAGCGDASVEQKDVPNDTTVVQTDEPQDTVNQEDGNDTDTIENNKDSETIKAEDEKAKAEAEAKAKAEAEKKAKAEAEKKAKAEADRKAKAEADKNSKKPQVNPGQKKEDPKPEEPQGMAWPTNKYTALLPKPSVGTLQSTGMQDGIYCMLFSGTAISDAKAYAATLIGSGYSNEVTETISGGTYLFGGGNSSGAFVVVNYQNGQMMVGIQP